MIMSANHGSLYESREGQFQRLQSSEFLLQGSVIPSSELLQLQSSDFLQLQSSVITTSEFRVITASEFRVVTASELLQLERSE